MSERGWVTFDLDGTLFDNTLRRFMVPGLEGALLPRRRRRLRRRAGRAPSRLRTLRSRLGAPWLRAIRSVTLRSVVPRTFVYPEALTVLERVRAMGFRTAAVTNGYLVYQEPLLEALAIRPLLDRLVAPERVGVAKPDPRVWTEGLAGEAVRLHVGDRLLDDVAGAHEAGIAAAWIHRRPGPLSRRMRRRLERVRPEVVATDLWGILAYLEGQAHGAAAGTGRGSGEPPAGD